MHISYKSEAKEMKPWQGVLFGLIFVVVGACLLFFSVKTISEYKEKNAKFTETSSIVVDYDRNSDGLEAIIVEYVVDGQTYTMTSNTYSSNPKDLGESVSIKYNPEDPSDAIWTNDSTNIVLPIASVVFMVVGIVIMVSGIKKSKKQNVVESTNNVNSTLGVQEQPVVNTSSVEQPVNTDNQNNDMTL